MAQFKEFSLDVGVVGNLDVFLQRVYLGITGFVVGLVREE